MSNEIAKTDTKPATVFSMVQHQIDLAVNQRGLTFPADYNVANAMTSARIALLTVENKEKKRILDPNGRPTGVVTQESIVNFLFDMVVQGLNVAKKQIYPIVYGNQLQGQRSYFGDIAVAERAVPGLKIYADVIYKGETFKPKKIHTKRGLILVVGEHDPAWPRTSKEIVGAYAGGTYTNPETGEVEEWGIELMDMEQIKKSWSKSKTIQYGGTFHTEQPDIACCRTVLRRYCKPIINSSADAIIVEAIKRQDLDSIEAEVVEEITASANTQELPLPEKPAVEAPKEKAKKREPAPAAPVTESPVQTTVEYHQTEPPEVTVTTTPAEDPFAGEAQDEGEEF